MKVYFVGIGFMALMLFQALLVHGIGQSKRAWRDKVRIYRYHQWAGLLIVAVVVVAALASALTLMSVGNPEVIYISQSMPLSPVFFIFFLGIVRAIYDYRIQNKDKDRATYDVFIISISISFAIEIALELTKAKDGMEQLFTSNTGTPAGTISIIIFSIVYLAWIFSILARQMVDIEKFPGRAVNRWLLNIFTRDTPIQIVIIGPKYAGKSMIFSSITGEVHKKETGAPMAGYNRLNVTGGANTMLGLSVIDTPGENMGQHLAAAIQYRTDILGLVINSKSLVPSSIEKAIIDGGLTFKRFLDNPNNFTTEKDARDDVIHGERTKEYLGTLWTATSGAVKIPDSKNAKTEGDDRKNTKEEIMSALSLVYSARRFSLIIYKTTDAQFSDAAKSVLQRIAEELGARFGLSGERCSCAILVANQDGKVSDGEFTNRVAAIAAGC